MWLHTRQGRLLPDRTQGMTDDTKALILITVVLLILMVGVMVAAQTEKALL